MATLVAAYALIKRNRPDVRENWRRSVSIALYALFAALIVGGAEFMFTARPLGLILFGGLVLVAAAMMWMGRNPS